MISCLLHVFLIDFEILLVKLHNALVSHLLSVFTIVFNTIFSYRQISLVDHVLCVNEIQFQIVFLYLQSGLVSWLLSKSRLVFIDLLYGVRSHMFSVIEIVYQNVYSYIRTVSIITCFPFLKYQIVLIIDITHKVRHFF